MSNVKFDAAAIKREITRNISSYDSDAKSACPVIWGLYEAALAGELFSGQPEDQDPPIKVTVVGLVEQITAKRDEIAAVYDAALAELDAEDTRRGAFAAALAEYFTVIAACHTSGDYKFDANTGILTPKDGGPKLPKQPTRSRTESDVTNARTKALKEKAEALLPFEAQLTTLSIAAEPSLEVNTARFSALLGTQVPTDLRF